LKDRLKQYGRAASKSVAIDSVVKRSKELLVVGGLVNGRKHGRPGNESGVNPRVDSVIFDTSKCGTVELQYHGASKSKQLIVSHAMPIPYEVPIRSGNAKAVWAEARETVRKAMGAWLPVISQCGLLDSTHPEAVHLRQELSI